LLACQAYAAGWPVLLLLLVPVHLLLGALPAKLVHINGLL
jgi:hypothetical protein